MAPLEDHEGPQNNLNVELSIKNEPFLNTNEPDSSERDAESPDDGHASLNMIKEEPLDEDISLSPQSGSGGEDGGPKINRRKRKNPIKLPQQNSFETEDDFSISSDGIDQNTTQGSQGQPPLAKKLNSLPVLESVFSANATNFQNNHSNLQNMQQNQPKQCAVMTEERARNQAINSMPRSTCPICGDKANGLHYGIYTCEAYVLFLI